MKDNRNLDTSRIINVFDLQSLDILAISMCAMSVHSVKQWQHHHNFNLDTAEGEQRTQLVVVVTAVMMVIEIAAGLPVWFLALLADGGHMGAHVAALAISPFAYRYARINADNPRFSFGKSYGVIVSLVTHDPKDQNITRD